MKVPFDDTTYEIRSMTVENITVTFRAFERIQYVKHPVDSDLQCLSIYVPEAYYAGKKINGYDLRTAPVLFENNIGGYMQSAPRRPEDEMFGHTSTFFYALQHGYVVATPGARGRDSLSPDGRYTGKAPAALVDLKAALRFLHAHAKELPGNMNHLISCGTSAGGAYSALVGVQSNDSDCTPYLQELGCEEAGDEVFGIMCYCPVTDLDHADMAYEWEFKGIPDYHRMHMEMSAGGRPSFTAEDGMMSDARIALSKDLADNFPSYVNGLLLKDSNGKPLTLDADGDGSFKMYISHKLQEAEGDQYQDFVGYMKSITRMKEAPAFDDVTMQNFENTLFGNEKTDGMHFTEFSMDRSVSNNPQMADQKIIRMLNPLYYMDHKMAKYWRIRQGGADRDIGFATPAILALKASETGADVDYKIVKDVPHDGDYDLKDLFAWIDRICHV